MDAKHIKTIQMKLVVVRLI